MQKISWLEKLIIKTERKRIKAKSWFITHDWMARMLLNKDVEVPGIYVGSEMDYYSNDGEMHLGLGEYEKALKLFGKMVELDPKYFDGYRMLGMAYAEMGKREEARKSYKKALKLALKSNAAEEEDSEDRIDEEFIEKIREGLASQIMTLWQGLPLPHNFYWTCVRVNFP